MIIAITIISDIREVKEKHHVSMVLQNNGRPSRNDSCKYAQVYVRVPTRVYTCGDLWRPVEWAGSGDIAVRPTIPAASLAQEQSTGLVNHAKDNETLWLLGWQYKD